MNNGTISQEKKELNDKIKDEVFRLEKENYLKKALRSDEMVAKIKKYVEGVVK